MDSGDKRKAATIEVPVEGGEYKEFDDTEMNKPAPHDDFDGNELSPEDLELKQKLEQAVERSRDSDAEVQRAALQLLADEIKSSTSSMTAVPKPLKFLKPHFETLEQFYEASPEFSNKQLLADILAVLALTETSPERKALHYKLKGTHDELGAWGHPFLHHLAGEIGQEYDERLSADIVEPVDDLLELVFKIVPHHMQHNAEAEAVDLLIETEQIETLKDSEFIDEKNCARVCLYLMRCADYVGEVIERHMCLDVAYALYLKQQQFVDACRIALLLNDLTKVSEVMEAADCAPVKKQLALLLGRHRAAFTTDDEELDELIGNLRLSEQFASLARALDVTEPKTPEEIYKSHLAGSGTRRGAGGLDETRTDSAKDNLANTLVNALVNAGYCADKLISVREENWVFRNRDHAKLSAAASLGMVNMWNAEKLNDIDQFVHSEDKFLKAGGMLAYGLIHTGTVQDTDALIALAGEPLEDEETGPGAPSTDEKAMAALALGLGYAGSRREDVAALLVSHIANEDVGSSMTLCSLSALALGMVYAGSANGDFAAVIVDRLQTCSSAQLDQAIARYMVAGLGLIYLGAADTINSVIEHNLAEFKHPLAKFATTLLRTCAFAGTGNVEEVQKLLHVAAEHPEGVEERTEAAADTTGAATAGSAGGNRAAGSASTSKSAGYHDSMHQSMAVMGMAMVVMGEELGENMLSRQVDHLLQYGDAAVRRGVPLALAMAHISNPLYSIVDKLSKLSHDPDTQVAQNAIFAMGLLGAGTNNSRIAGLLRLLMDFYKADPEQQFIVRLAQGLLHMGKGLLTVQPFHSDRLLLSPVAMAGLLPVFLSGLDLKSTLLSTHHYLLFLIATAMNPRMLVTVDEELNSLDVDVRIGEALETVGLAGKPKRIAGFQTHTSPALLNVTDRAELANKHDYKVWTNVLEGVVLVRKLQEDSEVAK